MLFAMRSVLHLYIFVEEDTLEVEFSSNKTSPDVAQGFIKTSAEVSSTSLLE